MMTDWLVPIGTSRATKMLYPGLLLDAMRWPLSDVFLMYAVGVLIAWISWHLVNWD